MEENRNYKSNKNRKNRKRRNKNVSKEELKQNNNNNHVKNKVNQSNITKNIKNNNKTNQNDRKQNKSRKNKKKPQKINPNNKVAKEKIQKEINENIKNVEDKNKIEEITKKSEFQNENNLKKGKDKKKTKKLKKSLKIGRKIRIAILIILMAFLLFLIYLAVRPKFKSITIELGKTDISAKDFLVSPIYENSAKIITDINLINLNAVQETDVILEFKGKQEMVKLKIVDTTAPTVKFKNMMAYLDYVPNPEDFIESKEDLSEMKVEFVQTPTFTDYGTYSVTVKVSDVYGNETTGTCELMITWLVQEVDLELGSEFSVANIVIDVDRFGSLVPETELAKVNTMVLGIYEINVDIEGKTYTSKVVVRDTTPPDLQIKNITIWDNQTIGGYQDFIISATDISGEVKTESLSTIDYSKIGDQTITIKATDVNGNVNEQNATLTIKHDTTGPVINGLSNIVVNKHTDINYESGVSATDDKDGTSTFTVNSSGVNKDAAGTYYATYTATDKAGNTSTYKRKVTVGWDQEDVQAKVDNFYNSYCAGKGAAEITAEVYNKVRYSATSYTNKSACIYYGLTNGGNCQVHSFILQALLNKAGYSAMVVYLPDGAHYWNKVGETHYDSTPGKNHLLVANSDDEKISEPWFASRSYTKEQFIVSY